MKTDDLQAEAKKLEKLWIQRERELRAKEAGKIPGIPPKAYEVMRCRQELQRAMGLVVDPSEVGK